jgi:hypothetical protein
MLPELDLDPMPAPVDADMRLHEPPHEHVWASEVRRHRLELEIDSRSQLAAALGDPARV